MVVNHLTRMRADAICVAGLDLDSGVYVRPVLDHASPLRRELLAEQGGLFGIAAVVALPHTVPVGRAPHVEDKLFTPTRASLLGYGGPDNFWKVLTKFAQRRLTAIFGHELLRVDRRCAIPVGSGNASLGCLVPVQPPHLFLNSDGRLRIELDDGLVAVEAPVTDLRLFEADHTTIRRDAVAHVAERLRSGEPAILSVGLTRAWRRPDEDDERHWLQVNNIHLQGSPTWNGVLPV